MENFFFSFFFFWKLKIENVISKLDIAQNLLIFFLLDR